MESVFNIALNRSEKALPKECTTVCGKDEATMRCCAFSDQQVADCTLNGTDTCDLGGEMHDGVMEIVQNGGMAATQEQYPYTSGSTGKLSQCLPPASNWVQTGLSGYVNVSSGDEDALLQASYEHGAISVGIDASSFSFQLYHSGVYNDRRCGNQDADLDHGVAVIGYGEGEPHPPGPLPPPPGPDDCKDNHYQGACLDETGCFWCSDPNLSWCQSAPCALRARETSSMPRRRGAAGSWWMVKNSWGADWGMGGFIAMSRNKANQCGIATDAIYASM